MDLVNRWARHFSKRLRGIPYDPWGSPGKPVFAAYAEEHRKYHTGAHLLDCFTVLDQLFPEAPIEVEAALWYHDVVYDTHAADNEERSADFATKHLTELGVSETVVTVVAGLILATKHNTVPADPMAQILVDVDLAILGTPPEKFDTYDRQIREEYAWVPDEAYKAGRKKVLQRFIDRDWIYSTKEMRRAGYEGRAQENIRRAIASLG